VDLADPAALPQPSPVDESAVEVGVGVGLQPSGRFATSPTKDREMGTAVPLQNYILGRVFTKKMFP
jgi:hypothetical protein